MDLPVLPPVKPMLAKAIDGFPAADAEVAFEPKWDGFRCIVFRDGDEIVLGSRNERPLTRYFPELLPALRAALPDRCVVDGEVIVATAGPDGDRLDFDALQQRIHPATSRVNLLAERTPASFVAFDVLALGDRDLRGEPLAVRRPVLEEMLADAPAPVHLTPSTRDRALAEQWFRSFEGAGLDGLMAKPLGGAYVEDKRVQFKIKHRRTADCVVAGFRWHKDGVGVGSLLLGLYDDEGTLHHLGVAASFSVKRRNELRDVLVPLTEGALEAHPWREWAEPAAHEEGRMPGAVSRWNATKDLSWVPVRLELVVEVEYVTVTNGRFRGVTTFVRWRPDRDVASCHEDQLVEAAPVPLADVLGARG